ncbi:hypothetical protein M413DRAFT_442384 [Hebeloma cylindrosporum]|uniref:DEK C-terminal domain-containing protein n=1 Tax=Hebeloma cylindrosporum TaxID=76867 RepID=A0A0C3C684_HEBCY|nr:hypothetical protein M413DRAFT_442384 [Hebeloma cylindrosporum h7]
MSIPPIPKLEEAAKKIVWGAQKKGNLKDFTPRIIRQTVEKEFSLDDGTLDAPEYKRAIKAATKAALDEKHSAPDGDVEDSKTKPSPKRKRKSDGPIESEMVDDEIEQEEKESAPTPKAKGKAKAKKVVSDDEDEDEDGSAKKKRKTVSRKPKAKVLLDDENDEEENAKKKRKPAGRKPKKTEAEEEEEVVKPAAKRSRARKDSKEFKSLEHVPTSDMEQDEPAPICVAGPSSLQSSKPTESTGKQKLSSPARKSTPKNDTTPRKPVSAAKPKLKVVAKSEDVEMDDAAVKSESELSVLIDEPPKRKRKSNSGEKKPIKPKEKKGKATTTLSKDEETIKRLKSLVVACGTRKVWSKVFQDLDTPQQQIKKLKEILADLGMTGRMSMEQAKAIKEKRELAKELEDVVEFASKVTGGRASRSQKEPSEGDPSKESEKGQESGSEDEENAAPKRSTTARKSIMAFLEDQSDDE